MREVTWFARWRLVMLMLLDGKVIHAEGWKETINDADDHRGVFFGLAGWLAVLLWLSCIFARMPSAGARDGM